jgi:hypothetical protein
MRNLDFNGIPFVPGKKARGIAPLGRPEGNRGLFVEIGEKASTTSGKTALPEAVLPKERQIQ